MTTCDRIADRLASGEPLNDDQRAHAELCPGCSSALESTELLGAIGRARGETAPGPGFSSRVASRAWERVAERRRNRRIGYGAATAGTLVTAAIGFMLLWPRPAADEPSGRGERAAAAPFVDFGDDLPVDETDAVRDLVLLTDADRALDYSANWEYIEEPVAPYAAMLGEDLDEENQ